MTDKKDTPTSNSAGGSPSQSNQSQNQKDLENMKLLIQLLNTRGDGG